MARKRYRPSARPETVEETVAKQAKRRGWTIAPPKPSLLDCAAGDVPPFDDRLEAAWEKYYAKHPERRGAPRPSAITGGALSDKEFRRLLDAMRPKVTGRVEAMYASDAAEDIVQSAYAEAWEKRATLKKASSAEAWINGIVNHEAEDYRRGQARHRKRCRRVWEEAQVEASPETAAEPAPLNKSCGARSRHRGLDKWNNESTDVMPDEWQEQYAGESSAVQDDYDDNPDDDLGTRELRSRDLTPEQAAIAEEEGAARGATVTRRVEGLSAWPEVRAAVAEALTGATTKEIAERLGVSVPVVNDRLKRAREKWCKEENAATQEVRSHMTTNTQEPMSPPAEPSPLGEFLMHSALHLFGSSGQTPSACLTAEELAEVTGKERPSAQARVLNHLGITHRQRPDGTLLVHRSHFDRLMGGATGGRDTGQDVAPNWDDAPRRPPAAMRKTKGTEHNAA